MICVSISDPMQIEPVIRKGAELLEFRLDLIKAEPAELYAGLPEHVRTVATCRPGGIPDDVRLRGLMETMALGAAYVDLGLESGEDITGPVLARARETGCLVIFSHHDFQRTPSREELEDLLNQCYQRGGDVAKITTMVNGSEDVLNLLSLFRQPGRKVVLGMGEAGRITRVVAPYLGAEFTFASPGGGAETAPGQLDLESLRKIYEMIGSL
jgi:3-dehydroquinate dehydratase-1